MSDHKINICHLYPDLLNLYGDNGNILCMKKRLESRGIECTVTGLSVGDKLNAGDYDIFFIGGGQDFEQDALLKDADLNKKADIRAAIDDEKPFLCICGGYQIMGQYYKTWDGKQLDFMGLIDFYTEGHEKRMIGNYMFECDALIERSKEASSPNGSGAGAGSDNIIVGFENHSGQTFLGEGIKPIGKVLAGYGNNEKAEYEGLHYKNVFGAYCHGPMLPKNPKFCDLLLQTALDRKYGKGTALLAEIDDTLENNAHNYMVDRLSK